MDHRFVDQDPVRPTEIEHKCEEVFVGSEVEQRYNYLVYHFDSESTYFWARAYLDDIMTVSLHGPFESRATMKPVSGLVDEALLFYLRRRFTNVQVLRNDGYAPA
jgi:hypothetical protein